MEDLFVFHPLANFDFHACPLLFRKQKPKVSGIHLPHQHFCYYVLTGFNQPVLPLGSGAATNTYDHESRVTSRVIGF